MTVLSRTPGRGRRSPGSTGDSGTLRTRPGRARRVRGWIAATSVAALGASLGLAALAAPAQATLAPAFGPVDVSTNFPSYYQDSTGLRVEPCLNSPNCLAPGGPFTAPDGEAFYNSASATATLPGAKKATLTLALEAAFAGPGSGQEVTFGRIRFVANGGLTPGATYTVTHPYGVDKFVANSLGAVPANAGTEDIGGLGPCLGPNAHAAGGACDFGEATNSRIGPFLKWDTGAPPGFLGDAGAAPHTITGSPKGTNFLQIVGPGVNVKQTAFTVSGKIAGPAMSSPSKLAFGSQEVGTASPAQTVTVKNIGSANLGISSVALDQTTGSPGDFTVSATTCPGASLVRDTASCTVSVKFTPTPTTPPGTRTATVLVTHNGLNGPERIALSGSAAATGTAPAVDFSPDLLTFANQRLGTQSAAKTVTINNTGTADLNVSSVALTGADASDFSTQNTCVGKAVAPATSCAVTVLFGPQLTAGAKTATVVITDDAPLSPRKVALSGTATAGLKAVGPVDPTTNFPSYYTDINGDSLQMCLDGPPNCLTSAVDLVAPAGEGFYNNATAKLTTSNNGKAVYVASLEGAFAGSAANQEIVFSRLRFTVSGGLVPNAEYTVTHPFGVDTYKANGSGQIVKNQGTQDVGGLGPCTSATAHAPGGVCDFATAMTGRFGPFIEWTAPSAANPAVPPAGFVGDAATPHTVVGSPLDTNFVRIEGPGINPAPTTANSCPATVGGFATDCIQTNLFTVAGKFAP